MNPQEIRRGYAETLGTVANLGVNAIVDAFARVRREEFLGPPPWQVGHSPSRNPPVPFSAKLTEALEDIYQDVVVAIDPVRQINNGQPSLHAQWLEAMSPQPGESVLHIGCGTGYYTAILAELVGTSGRVVAYEIEPDLAVRARTCLLGWPHVRVEVGEAANRVAFAMSCAKRWRHTRPKRMALSA